VQQVLEVKRQRRALQQLHSVAVLSLAGDRILAAVAEKNRTWAEAMEDQILAAGAENRTWAAVAENQILAAAVKNRSWLCGVKEK
jgi:hypothetical protein